MDLFTTHFVWFKMKNGLIINCHFRLPVILLTDKSIMRHQLEVEGITVEDWEDAIKENRK